MVGSSQSIGMPNTVINTATAQVLGEIADELDRVKAKAVQSNMSPEEVAQAVDDQVYNIICQLAQDHKRIIFSGNGYSPEWIEEAKRRGLCHFKSCLDVYPCLLAEKNVRLFENNKIMTRDEMVARTELYYELYANTKLIESSCLSQMTHK